METFYLHIGLHKTATSTLQKHVFPNIDHALYLPRDTKNDNSLYFRICEYCFTPSQPQNLIALRQDILKSLNRTKMILSEEWFTSDYCGQYGWDSPPWQVKLKRLASLLDGCSFSLMATLRSPLTALYSYYATMRKVGVAEHYGCFSDFIEQSNDAMAFDYYYLDSTVKRLFGRNCQYLKFETLESQPEVFFVQLSKWLCLQPPLEPVRQNENRTISLGGLRIVSRNNKLASDYAKTQAIEITHSTRKKRLMAKFTPPQIMLTPKPSRKDIDSIQKKFKATINLFNDASSLKANDP